MRKLLISLLLASAAATPALADPPQNRDQAREERQQAREERQQAREERQQTRQESRSEGQQFSVPERSQPQIQVRQQSLDRPDRRPVSQATSGGTSAGNTEAVRTTGNSRHDIADSVREWRGDERVQTRENRGEGVRATRESRRDIADSVREWRGDERTQERQDRVEARELRQSTRPLPNVMRTRVPVVSHVPREGTQPPALAENRVKPAPQWSTSWRHNNKYDWYNWRQRHRSLFHLGFYYDPFGWGYQPYSIGWRLWPSFYGSRYWLSDPWMYRLPYAPPGYRWIRYWNDAILVDTWDGQVVDVIYNFFW